MAIWINELGAYLAEKHPDRVRLTPEKHWQFFIRGQWVTAPDHYVDGFLILILVRLGMVRIRVWQKMLLLLEVFGFYLILDDLPDLEHDISTYLSKKH